jgi:hypothetical protein
MVAEHLHQSGTDRIHANKGLEPDNEVRAPAQLELSDGDAFRMETWAAGP